MSKLSRVLTFCRGATELPKPWSDSHHPHQDQLIQNHVNSPGIRGQEKSASIAHNFEGQCKLMLKQIETFIDVYASTAQNLNQNIQRIDELCV